MPRIALRSLRVAALAGALWTSMLLGAAPEAQDPRFARGKESRARPPGISAEIWRELSNISRSLALLRQRRASPILAAAPLGTPPPLSSSELPGDSQGPLPNALVNDPALDVTDQDTQSLAAVLALGGGQVLAVYLDSGSFDGTNHHLDGWSTSADSGATFQDRGTLVEDPEEFGDGGGAVLARDAITGRVYLATLAMNDPQTISVFRSDDPMAGFEPPVSAYPLYYDLYMDKPWIAVDSYPGPGAGNVYVLARNFDFWDFSGMRFSSSTDGGATFVSGWPQVLSNQTGNGANLVVSPDHTVHAFWCRSTPPAAIVTRRTQDFGATFSPSQTVAALASNGTDGDLGLEFRTNAFPQAVANPLDEDRLILAYADDAPGTDRADIFLVESFDGGLTWTQPERVNSDATSNDQFAPTIALTPDGARLFVGWYDRRRDPFDWRIEYWGRIAEVSATGLVFGSDFPISTVSFPAVYGQDGYLAQRFMGDFDQASADDEAFYVGWSDHRLGNSFHRNQPDVRFARIPRDGPGPMLFPEQAVFLSGNCTTQDDAPEPGETVSISLCLENLGTASSSPLTATLVATGGVTAPGSPQTYGPIPAGGGSECRAFSFTVDPGLACGAEIVPTLALSDGASELRDVHFSIPVGDWGTAQYGPYENPTPISIPDGQVSSPYPSTIGIGGAPTTIDSVAVILNGYSHVSCSDDVDMLLLSPTGSNLVFLGDVGGCAAANGVELVLFDSAPSRLPLEPPLVSGNYRSTNYWGPDGLPPPAPPYPSAQAQPAGLDNFETTFSGQDPNGVWSLFVEDALGSGGGALEGGWALTFYRRSFACRCHGPHFAGDFEVGDTSQWDHVVRD